MPAPVPPPAPPPAVVDKALEDCADFFAYVPWKAGR